MESRIYEIGTGNCKQVLQQEQSVMSMSWSAEGRWFYIAAHDAKAFRVYQVDKDSQENMLTVYDAIKRDHKFWSHFPIQY